MQLVWICIELAFILRSIQIIHGNPTISFLWMTKFDKAVAAMRKNATANCTKYIPDNMQKLMKEYNPPEDPVSGQKMLVPTEYLHACLYAELPHVLDSSPFTLVSRPLIRYNIGLNHVVSLGFDGVLVTKALHFYFSR